MTAVFSIAAGLLIAAGALCVVRLLRPASIADRIVALDTLLVVVVSGIAVAAAVTRSGVYLNVLVVVGLLGFTGTTVVARYIERRGA